MTLVDPIAYAIPAFIALIVVEMLIARVRDPARYCPRDTLTSLLLGFGSTVSGALFAGVILALAYAVYPFRLFDIGFVWWAWPIAFVAYDFTYYWQHRAGHRVRWMWAAHVNHHSSQHYNLSTALRQTWTGAVAGAFLFTTPLYLIGFPPPMVFFVGALNLIYQFWVHTEAVGRCPRWVEAVMNTPSHHRVHHAVNPRCLDRNYAGVFIVWDKLFGTFAPERDGEVLRYGLIRQIGRFDVLYAAFHEWIGIARDLGNAPWRAKLGYAFGPPGWSHDGSRDTSDMIRRRWEESEACLKVSSTSSSSAGDRAAARSPGG